MRDLSLKARLLIAATLLAGGALGALQVSRVPASELLLVALVACIAALLQTRQVVGVTERTSYNLALAVYGFALIHWGAAGTCVVVLFACLVEWAVHRMPWYIQAFNTAALMVVISASGAVINVLGGSSSQLASRGVLPQVFGIATFVVVNHLFVGVVVSLARGERLLDTGVFAPTTLGIDAALLATGAIAATATLLDPLAGVLAFPLLYFMHRTLSIPAVEHKASVQLSEDLLLVLSQVADLRDPFMVGHSQHVANYAELIAGEMGLGEERVRAIRQAGLIHDIGKLGIPEAVLFKPGKLDAADVAIMATHSANGAALVAETPSLAPFAPVVRHHHERFDGSGYPDGVAGRRIPLEARILAVADSTDAMASDRPYRRGLAPSVVIEELKRGAGSQFDPEVVRAFLGLIEREGESVINNSAHVVLSEGTHLTLAHRQLPEPDDDQPKPQAGLRPAALRLQEDFVASEEAV